jgi:hypothetical protein
MNQHRSLIAVTGLAVIALAPGACHDDEDLYALDAAAEADASSADAVDDVGGEGRRFSFFVTSWASMQRLAGSPAGFGGDLRFGKADGLSGGDEICRVIAETSLPGSGSKGWRAFLSVTKGPDGQPVHAIDRVGEGPWYDRRGRLVALTKADLIQTRPGGADASIINDLPNEDGVSNHAPDGVLVDNHDILTGSDRNGRLYSSDWSHNCHDWTSAVGSDGKPRVGHSWTRVGGVGDLGGGPDGMRGPGMMVMGGDFPDGGPFVVNARDGGPPRIDGEFPDGGPSFGCTPGDEMVAGGPPDGGVCIGGPGGGGDSWISTLDEAGCAPGADLVEKGPPDPRNPTVGSGGGYGAIYCLALKP